METDRRCWWCGIAVTVDIDLPESNGLIRDDSTLDGSESWICADHEACLRRAREIKWGMG